MPATNTACQACGLDATNSTVVNGLCVSCARRFFICNQCHGAMLHLDESTCGYGYCRFCRPSTNRFTYEPIGDAPHLGWELEVESSEDEFAQAQRETLRAFPQNFVTLKDDGSLSENGFEIVSRPASIAKHKEVCTAFFNAVRDGKLGRLSSWSNNTCGLHVHICRKSIDWVRLDNQSNQWKLDEHTIALIVCFVNLPRNRRFIETIAGRDANGYTTFQRKRMQNAHVRTGHKYEAVNLEHSNTLEFRIFKGTLMPRSFFKALEFVVALSEFCRATFNTRKALSLATFIRYIGENHATYPNLDSFISNRWYGKRDRNGNAPWRLVNNRKPPPPPIQHGSRTIENN